MKSKEIFIKGAKLHNLKDITVGIPHNQLAVITELLGPGKSSLAFDTFYAERQHRYVESLSSYAHRFLGRFDKPKVDNIIGIVLVIAIKQRVNTSNPRSTVGIPTEIYDYLKLLFAHISKTYSPIPGKEVKKHTVTDVVGATLAYLDGTKLLLLASISIPKDRTVEQALESLLQQGYTHILHQGGVIRLEKDSLPKELSKFWLVVDRIMIRHNENFQRRLVDAVGATFFEGKEECMLQEAESEVLKHSSNRFEMDGITFLEPGVHLFGFNGLYGTYLECGDHGDTIGLDENLIVLNTKLSVYENAIYPWRGGAMNWSRGQLVNDAYKFDFLVYRPQYELNAKQRQLVQDGNKYFTGLTDFFRELEEKSHKVQNRVLLARYRGKTRCYNCHGRRLRKKINYAKVQGKNISNLVEVSIEKL